MVCGFGSHVVQQFEFCLKIFIVLLAIYQSVCCYHHLISWQISSYFYFVVWKEASLGETACGECVQSVYWRKICLYTGEIVRNCVHICLHVLEFPHLCLCVLVCMHTAALVSYTYLSVCVCLSYWALWWVQSEVLVSGRVKQEKEEDWFWALNNNVSSPPAESTRHFSAPHVTQLSLPTADREDACMSLWAQPRPSPGSTVTRGMTAKVNDCLLILLL